MDIVIVRGSREELEPLLADLGLKRIVSQPVNQASAIEQPERNTQREQLDAFMRTLTPRQRSLVTSLAAGALQREQLVEKLGISNSKGLQTILAAIQRKATGILGSKIRVIRSSSNGDSYLYQLDPRVVEFVKS